MVGAEGFSLRSPFPHTRWISVGRLTLHKSRATLGSNTFYLWLWHLGDSPDGSGEVGLTRPEKVRYFGDLKTWSVSMKKILSAAAALAALASTSYAADLPARMPVKAAPAPVVSTWTGCYIGAGGGYGLFDQHHSTTVVGAAAPFFIGDTGGRGWFGTVQGGCDYQFNESFVIGVFGDYDWSGMRGDFSNVGVIGGVGTALVGREKLDSAWAVGGRVGYLINPQVLTYISGGYTEANFDRVNLAPIGGATTFFYPDHTYTGWFLGSGYEYRLPWFSGLTWKTEYRFSELGRDTLTRFTAAGAPLAITTDSHKYVQTVRSELVWRFNWWR
jgi:outer membrane immunogenic protein